METEINVTEITESPEYESLINCGWNLNIARRYLIALAKGDQKEADTQKMYAEWDIQQGIELHEAEQEHEAEVCSCCGGDGKLQTGRDCDNMPLTRICPKCGGDGKGSRYHY